MADIDKDSVQLKEYKTKQNGQSGKDDQPHSDGQLPKNGDGPVKRKKGDKAGEQSSLIECQKMSPESASRLYTAAVAISWISIIFSLGSGIAGIFLSVQGKSEALFAYGLDATLDSFSSMAVVWRFHGNVECVYSQARERKACIAIGILFLVSAFSLIFKSSYAIATETHETKEILLFEAFALTCGIISTLIAIVKIYVGLKLDSQALYTDSIITIVGAISCFAGVAGLQLYVEDTDLWYMDSVFGVICGLFLLLFGIRLLYIKIREKPAECT